VTLLVAAASACATHPPPAIPDRTPSVGNHRLTLHFANASAPPTRPLLVFATGDGGMHRKDLDLYRHLESWGYPIVGFDAHEYVEHLGPSEVTTPEQLADDYQHMIASARDALHLDPARPIVLVGVSRGAGLSVVAAGQLHDAIAGVVAIALTREEEYVRWVHHVLPRREVMVDIEEYLPELGDLPLAVVQSAHDKYMPGPIARALLGPDTARRWLQVLEARNHSFSDAREEMYQATERAIGWIESLIPHRQSPIGDPGKDDRRILNR
jgi:pimeloyl-ACP methyl ester carboxylesterase